MDHILILQKLQNLGFDTGLIKKAIILSETDKTFSENFRPFITTLNALCDSVSPSSVMAIEMVFYQIKKLFPLASIEEKSKAINSVDASKLFEELSDLKKAVGELSRDNFQFQILGPSQDRITDSYMTDLSLDKIFIDPIDNSKFDNIKSNVDIEEKTSGNISGKLSKLKNLKKNLS